MTAPPRAGRRLRVLLADDSEGLRLLVRSWLSDEDDVEVVAEATNGAEAVALADAHRPDVVVLDVAMPVMDGLEALTELRQRFPGLPVVMHSGFAEGQVASQALARGACAFVEKSGDLDPLLAAIRAASALPVPRPAPVPQVPVQRPPAPVVVAASVAPRQEGDAAAPRKPPAAELAVAVLCLLALVGLPVAGSELGSRAAPALVLLVVPVAVLALRHGRSAGAAAAAAATAAAVSWAVAEPAVGVVGVLACAAASTVVALAVGGSADARRRAEGSQRKVSDAVVASNRALAEANDLLRQLNDDLQASNDDLRQFGQVAGHDLAEPLRTIGSYAKLLEQRYDAALDDRGRQYLGLVGDGVRRMQALVDDLRSYARAGQASLRLEPVALNDVVDEVRADLQRRLVERRARLQVGPLPVVQGDRVLLRLVLQNLINNALTFTESAAPLVEVAAEQAGGRWHVRVSDDGIGLDPAHAEAVFGLFTRLHTREEYPGTGLGLAIAKRVVERHGGTIALGPRPGGGTTVTLTLPDLELAA